MEKPVINIIFRTYNRANLVSRSIKSLIRQEVPGSFYYEIIVIDNGSTDHTKSIIQKISLDSPVPIRYVFEDRQGYSYASNRGLLESTAQWVAFFDDDEEAEANWLMELFGVANDKKADCVGGSIKLSLPVEKKLLGPLCRKLLGEKIFLGNPEIFKGKELPSSGNLLISRDVINTVGFFDESLFSGGEDSDYLRRLLAAGYSIWTAPKAVIYHIISEERLTSNYLRKVSIRWGTNFAKIDYKKYGRNKTFLLCLTRLGQALLVNFPKLFFYRFKNDKLSFLDTKCLLWRALGYFQQNMTIFNQ